MTLNTPTIRPSVREVQAVIAKAKGLRVEHLRSPSRRRDWAYPRQVAVYLARELCGKSYPQLGRSFQRDHSTCVHAHQKITRLAQQNPALEIALNRYREAIAELVAAKAAVMREMVK